ncbi:hypothetical protein CRUP_022041 [Coryphaenoides rupestris]|nr:hypothetical protein CRUP_022041 [Coryphaenoides rupestris]
MVMFSRSRRRSFISMLMSVSRSLRSLPVTTDLMSDTGTVTGRQEGKTNVNRSAVSGCDTLYRGGLQQSIAELAETTSLAQAVEALLLNELQDLGLDPLPQLTAHNNNNDRQGAAHTNKREEEEEEWEEGLTCSVM